MRRPEAPVVIPILQLRTAPSVLSMLRLLQWSLVGVTVIAIGLTAWWWHENHALEAMAERYESAAARTETLNREFEAQLAREGLTLSGDQIALVQGKVAFANLLAAKRAFSWTRMLSELEDTVPEHLSISSVKLDVQQSGIVIDGVARTLQDVNLFVQALQQHRAFHKAVLAKHEAQKGRDGRDPATIDAGGNGPRQGFEFSLAVGYRLAVMNGGFVE